MPSSNHPCGNIRYKSIVRYNFTNLRTKTIVRKIIGTTCSDNLTRLAFLHSLTVLRSGFNGMGQEVDQKKTGLRF